MERGLTPPHWQDLEDVDSIAGNLVTRAGELLESDRVVLLLLDEEGSSLHAWDAVWPRAEGRGPVGEAIDIGQECGLAGRVVREGRILIAPLGSAEVFPGMGLSAGVVAGVPLPGRSRSLGAIVIAIDAERGTPEERLQIVEGIARDAGAALERLRLDRDARRASERIDQILEHQRRIARASRLDEITRMTAKAAVDGTRAAFSVIWMAGETNGAPQVTATFGAPGGDPDGRLEALGKRAAEAIDGRTVIRGSLPGQVGTSFLIAPMIVFDEVHGAVACVERVAGSRLESSRFDREDETYIATLALQVAMAAENARLSSRVRAGEGALRDARKAVLRQERTAAVGEMAQHFIQESRAPLDAILTAARRLEKEIPADDPLHDATAAILREGCRLQEEIVEQLAFGRAPAPCLEITNLTALVREGLDRVRPDLDLRGVKLIEVAEGRLPAMLLDAERVLHLLSNILANAAHATRAGNRIRVRTRAAEGWAQVEIAHDGDSRAGDVVEQLFIPFGAAGHAGGGLGLAIADRIVREHGGEIRVRTDPEWSAIFTVSLPVRTNQDRRRSKDRRASRDRRRVA